MWDAWPAGRYPDHFAVFMEEHWLPWDPGAATHSGWLRYDFGEQDWVKDAVEGPDGKFYVLVYPNARVMCLESMPPWPVRWRQVTGPVPAHPDVIGFAPDGALVGAELSSPGRLLRLPGPLRPR